MLSRAESSAPSAVAIISNTRCGSTWLATALGNCHPNVSIDYEVKLEDYERSAVHARIGSVSPVSNLKQIYRLICEESGDSPAVVGTKITMDASVEPHHNATVTQRLQKLAAIHGGFPELRVIHLTRRLCGQSASRGGHTTVGGSSTPAAPARQSRLTRNAHAAQYSRSTPSTAGSQHACEVLHTLHRLTNDICAALVFSGSPRYLQVNYEDLHEEWPATLRFLELESDMSLMQASVTQQNRPPGVDASCPLGQALTETRDEVLALIASGGVSPALRDSFCLSSGLLIDNAQRAFHGAAQDPSEVAGRDLLASLGSRLLTRLRLNSLRL